MKAVGHTGHKGPTANPPLTKERLSELEVVKARGERREELIHAFVGWGGSMARDGGMNADVRSGP